MSLVMDLLMGVILGASGVLMVAGGLTGWDWFMGLRGARLLAAALGATAARAVYVLVGLFSLGLAVWFLVWFAWEWRQAGPGA